MSRSTGRRVVSTLSTVALSGLLLLGAALVTPGIAYAAPAPAHTATPDRSDSDSPHIMADDAPVLTFPATLPMGAVGMAYEQALTRTGGTAPFAWSIDGGTLPGGLSLDPSTGLLSGAPTDGGGSEFTVRIVDAVGLVDTRAAELFVKAAPTVQLSVDDAAVRFGTRVEVTVALGDLGATGTLDFRVTAPDGAVTELGSATLLSGRASLTLTPAALGRNAVTASYSGDERHLASTSAPVFVEVSAYAGQAVITEFRTSGPDGPADQYVELYNRGAPLPLAGLELRSGSGSVVTLPADAPVLDTFRTYLVSGADFSLSTLATPDMTVPTLGTDGFRLTAPDAARSVVDEVGPVSGFHLGSGLPAMDGAPAAQWAFVRTETGGRPNDTRDNRADFALVSSTGGTVGGVQSMRGSASPTGLRDPWQHNRQALSFRLDSSRTPAESPNRAYVVGSPGTLVIRRTITNTGTSTITEARTRITALSEAHGLPYRGAQPARPARIRAVDPAVSTSQVTVADRGVITVQHLAVDAPITSAAGGGLNSTLTVPLPSGGLAPGASVDVAFTFQVDVRGTFWFGYDLDARTSSSSGRVTASTRAFGTKLSDTQLRRRLVRSGMTRGHALTGPDTGRL